MSTWPEYEGKKKIPEGHYQFRINKEPELQAFDYKDPQTGEPKKGRRIRLYAIGINSEGEFPMSDQITVWDERYEDLKNALGVEHGQEIRVTGSYFEADIVHEMDKKDPTKSWPRLTNIRPNGDIPEARKPSGDDIPF